MRKIIANLLILLTLCVAANCQKDSSKSMDSVLMISLEDMKKGVAIDSIPDVDNFVKITIKNHECCQTYKRLDSLNVEIIELNKKKHKKEKNIYRGIIAVLFGALMISI